MAFLLPLPSVSLPLLRKHRRLFPHSTVKCSILCMSGKDMDKRVGKNVNEGRLHGVKGAAYEETM